MAPVDLEASVGVAWRCGVRAGGCVSLEPPGEAQGVVLLLVSPLLMAAVLPKGVTLKVT